MTIENSNDKQKTDNKISVGIFEIYVLALLANCRNPISGSDAWEQLETHHGKRLHSGTVYSTLKKIVDKGLAENKTASVGRPINLYLITTHGKHQLNEHFRLLSYQSLNSTVNTNPS